MSIYDLNQSLEEMLAGLEVNDAAQIENQIAECSGSTGTVADSLPAQGGNQISAALVSNIQNVNAGIAQKYSFPEDARHKESENIAGLSDVDIHKRLEHISFDRNRYLSR